MSRIASCFGRLREHGRRALIPFVTAGFPSPEASVPILHGLVEAGADVLELGVPFSDPMADGPVIQRASEAALRAGMSLLRVLDIVTEFRATDERTPVVLMGYLNPIEAMGYARFAVAAERAGVDGVLTVDMPPEESRALVTELRGAALDPIFLIAPTSGPERIERICAQASGYLYYVSLKGVTGVARVDADAVAAALQPIRAHTDLPIGVGFGITDGEAAARIAECADAVVVGSALVARIEAAHAGAADVTAPAAALLAEMRAAMDGVTDLEAG